MKWNIKRVVVWGAYLVAVLVTGLAANQPLALLALCCPPWTDVREQFPTLFGGADAS